jgi:excisionase family DNA binding protein
MILNTTIMKMTNPFEVLDERLSNIESLLLDIKHPQRPPEPSDRCQLKDACEITGLSKAAIYKMTHEKTLPHAKFGSRLIFSRRSLIAWVDSHTVSPTAKEDEIKAKLIASAEKKIRSDAK